MLTDIRSLEQTTFTNLELFRTQLKSVEGSTERGFQDLRKLGKLQFLNSEYQNLLNSDFPNVKGEMDPEYQQSNCCAASCVHLAMIRQLSGGRSLGFCTKNSPIETDAVRIQCAVLPDTGRRLPTLWASPDYRSEIQQTACVSSCGTGLWFSRTRVDAALTQGSGTEQPAGPVCFLLQHLGKPPKP